MLKVHAAVEVQLAACTCNIPTSPSYLKLRNLTLIDLMSFLSEIYDTNRVKVGCRLHLCAHSLLTIGKALSCNYGNQRWVEITFHFLQWYMLKFMYDTIGMLQELGLCLLHYRNCYIINWRNRTLTYFFHHFLLYFIPISRPYLPSITSLSSQ